MTHLELALDIFIGLMLIAFVSILYKGFKNDLVIYQDRVDFMRTVMIVALIIMSPFLIDTTWIKNHNIEFVVSWIITPLLLLFFFVLVVDSFYLCITNNNNRYLLGSLIAIFRVFYLLLAVLLIFKLIDNIEKSRNYRSSIFQLALVGSLGYGLYLLVNGKAVATKRNAQINMTGILE